MLVSSNHLKYPRINAFINHHVVDMNEFEKYNENLKGKRFTLFSNHLMRYKDFYRKHEIYFDEQRDFTLKKLYEGKKSIFIYYIDHPSLKRDENNKLVFDYKAIKTRIKDYIVRALNYAEENFENNIYSTGSFYVGQYLALKELYRLSSLYEEDLLKEVVY